MFRSGSGGNFAEYGRMSKIWFGEVGISRINALGFKKCPVNSGINKEEVIFQHNKMSGGKWFLTLMRKLYEVWAPVTSPFLSPTGQQQVQFPGKKARGARG